jgi:hypothetical protein
MTANKDCRQGSPKFIKSQNNSKKVDNARDIGINGGKAAMFRPKITELAFIPFFNAVYEMLPDDIKKELD